MRFTVSEFYAVCGAVSTAGAPAAPFPLYRLIQKAVFGLAFRLCLWTSQLLAYA